MRKRYTPNAVRTPSQAVLYTGRLADGVTYIVRAFSIAEARLKIKALCPADRHGELVIERAQIR
jgi:hypothetical protein